VAGNNICCSAFADWDNHVDTRAITRRQEHVLPRTVRPLKKHRGQEKYIRLLRAYAESELRKKVRSIISGSL
jgi:hypothetical protein